eukprot:13871287-Alexandrium_andersonii.AAC.1
MLNKPSGLEISVGPAGLASGIRGHDPASETDLCNIEPVKGHEHRCLNEDGEAACASSASRA